MSIRSIIVIVAILLLAEHVKAENNYEGSKDDKVMYSLLDGSLDDMIPQIRSMNLEDRANVVRAVRENKSGQWASVHGDVLQVLAFLGDPVERKKAVATFRAGRQNRPELTRLGEPWVIEEFAPELFRAEEFPIAYHGDLDEPPLSYGAASLIIANLQNATIYRDEVLRWAKGISPFNQPTIRAVMRDWWKDNEQFFKEKNYQAVKPGRTLELPQPAPPPPKADSPSVQPNALPPSLSPSPAPAPLPSLQPGPTGSWTLTAIIAALLALLCAGFWLRQKRK